MSARDSDQLQTGLACILPKSEMSGWQVVKYSSVESESLIHMNVRDTTH